ncbi:hypothetical protein V6N13_087979 [Hibiscus sabdariffa]
MGGCQSSKDGEPKLAAVGFTRDFRFYGSNYVVVTVWFAFSYRDISLSYGSTPWWRYSPGLVDVFSAYHGFHQFADGFIKFILRNFTLVFSIGLKDGLKDRDVGMRVFSSLSFGRDNHVLPEGPKLFYFRAGCGRLAGNKLALSKMSS